MMGASDRIGYKEHHSEAGGPLGAVLEGLGAVEREDVLVLPVVPEAPAGRQPALRIHCVDKCQKAM